VCPYQQVGMVSPELKVTWRDLQRITVSVTLV
jgi:hypothetical protein